MRLSPRRLPLALTPLLLALAAAQAGAAECTVNVLDAYHAAKSRGWQFECWKSSVAPHIKAAFVTYPPAAIGCAFKTPPVLSPLDDTLGSLHLFKGPGTGSGFKNGWYVKDYSVTGASGDKRATMYPAAVRVGYRISEKPKPERTYNVRLTSLTLTRVNGNCANVIAEAF